MNDLRSHERLSVVSIRLGRIRNVASSVARYVATYLQKLVEGLNNNGFFPLATIVSFPSRFFVFVRR